MTLCQPDADSETRLDALRGQAAHTGTVAGTGVRPVGAPFPRTALPGYYGQPVVKPPVWTWEIPLYFFMGGAAGACAVIAALGESLGAEQNLVIARATSLISRTDIDAMARAAHWIAAVGGILCALLLISDLGRPARFLNMLRVFKRRSPMSVGAWTLVAFQIGSILALLTHEGQQRLAMSSLAPWHVASAGFAAFFGLILLSYTGVLLAVTAIPVWHENRTLLPLQFSVSALGSGAAMLEMLGHLLLPLSLLGFVASLAETVLFARVELRRVTVDDPLRHGRSGWMLRTGGWLAGPLALIFRSLGLFMWLRYQNQVYSANPDQDTSLLLWLWSCHVAALSFLSGAYFVRAGWLAAGQASALDPRATLMKGGQGSGAGDQ